MKKNGIIFIGLVFFLNMLSGCSGLQKEPVIKNYFDLEIKLADSPSQKRGNNDTLIVKQFFITPEFDSYSFVYRMTKNEYITDFYNEFISYPAKLITEKITETLCSSSYFTPAPTSMKQDITYRLSGKITRLYGDFQNADDPKAIIEIRMTLE
ncbi:MAG: hypothetical protein KKE44_03995, partial [Proteobacteria bacterium]|nr:hypothetical protein [Pseudomonadota bacterium]MBU1581891.1 hypothetical protein [Pseudomonadota bacterium]MBU2454296.1 hypothetical protein [Pseudomonadota bacterium]